MGFHPKSIPQRLKPVRPSRHASARLNRLRKNSEFGPVLKGHEFTRAEIARRIEAGFSP
jgi:hypothetical protein